MQVHRVHHGIRADQSDMKGLPMPDADRLCVGKALPVSGVLLALRIRAVVSAVQKMVLEHTPLVHRWRASAQS